MILKLQFAGRTKRDCFENLRKNIKRIRNEVEKGTIVCCYGIVGNTGYRYFLEDKDGKLMTKQRSSGK